MDGQCWRESGIVKALGECGVTSFQEVWSKKGYVMGN